MKIRSGFVSNSSSSSFVIDGKTVYWVASWMLKQVESDSFDFSDFSQSSRLSKKHKKLLEEKKLLHKAWNRNVRRMVNMPDIQDGKIGVTLPSCNYDTYIIKNEGLIYVSTSRNYEWDFPDNIVNDHGGGADDDDNVHKIIKQSFFYNVRNGLIHSYEIWAEDRDLYYCNTCKGKPFSLVETKDGRILCARCYNVLGKSPNKIIEELMETNKRDMSAFKYLEP